MSVEFVHHGDFSKAEQFFNKLRRLQYLNVLSQYGREGVAALSAATPVDTGLTAQSWSYDIIQNESETKIVWTNSNVNKGVNIALILQYGHGTGTGGYVQGRDYINPAIQPIFDKMAKAAWREVISL